MNLGKRLDKEWKDGLLKAKVKDLGDEQYAATCSKCGGEIIAISPGVRGPIKCPTCGEIINLTSLWGKSG